MRRDHEAITLTEFKGTFNRGEDEVCPSGYFLDSLNIAFREHGVETRKGTDKFLDFPAIRRMAKYQRIGEAPRLLILDTAGSLWDSTNLSAPILTIPAMTDFNTVSLFNRAYITPSNGLKGLPGEKVYVYEGSGTARPAAGVAPTGSPIVVTSSATAGKIEKGKHLFAVAFETQSGHIGAPGPQQFTLYDAPGAKKAALSNIPVGPVGTVARHIIATQTLSSTYAGDDLAQSYYFVPFGRIGDNTTTTLTVDFFDADLVSSADFLFDQMVTIPAGVGIGVYGNRLAVWGPDDDESACFFSKAGSPESIDALEGIIKVFPGDSGGGIRNAVEFRSQFYFIKAGHKTYVTQDSGDNATFWKVTQVDASVGTECHGIAKILDNNGATLDTFVLVDQSGVLLFDGSFSGNNLTAYIDDIWKRVNLNALHTVEIALDTIKQLCYVAVPLDGADDPTHLLVGDYQDGSNPDGMRWTIWQFPVRPTTLFVDTNFTTKKSVLKFASLDGSVFAFDETKRTDYNAAITSFIRFAYQQPEGAESGQVFHFDGIDLRVKGSGTLNIEVFSQDDAITMTCPSLSLTAAPGQSYPRGFNAVTESCSVKLSMNSANDYFQLIQYSLFAKPLWASQAE